MSSLWDNNNSNTRCFFAHQSDNPPSELRKSRPQSAEFSQSPSPRPGRPLSGPPLVSSQSQVFNWIRCRSALCWRDTFHNSLSLIHTHMWVNNLRILMSQWVEPAERLLLFHGSSLPLHVWKLNKKWIHCAQFKRGPKIFEKGYKSGQCWYLSNLTSQASVRDIQWKDDKAPS